MMFGKPTTPKQSQTQKQFDLFIKRRNEKTSILHSQSQTIGNKVRCFEELIKLNRKGTMIEATPATIESTPKCQSYKNLIVCSNENFAEVDQDSQFAFGKLNKMANGLNSWEVSKQGSKHQTESRQNLKSAKVRKEDGSKSKVNKKGDLYHSNSTNSSRIKTQSHNREYRKGNWFVESDKKANYFPLKKMHRNNMAKKFHQYQHSTPNINSISIKSGQFTGLRRQIDELTNKAKQYYGISFEPAKEQNVPVKEQNDFVDIRPTPEQREVSTAISRTQLNRAKQNNYLKMMKEHTRQDASIPMQFMGAIRSKGITRPMSNENWKRYIRI